MARKIFGPTIFSFISYAGVNLIFIVLPVVFFITKEWWYIGIVFIFVGLFSFYLSALADAQWVIVDDNGVTVVTYLFNRKEIKYKIIEKIKSGNKMFYGSIGAWRGGFVRSAWRGFIIFYRWDHECAITTSMWSDDVESAFLVLLSEKGHENEFKIVGREET